ncbi:MAG: outer membrane protein assembly factor BamE [Pseudomonadota bacterium]|nr:outer membrane protein assembly factor BamE [Pseudomonadota bacterium]
MKLNYKVFLGVFSLVFVGCSQIPFVSLDVPNLGDLPFIHRIDVQQGNVVTQDMLAQLKPLMEKKKVLFIMGTSVIADTFNSHQWDYIYSFHKGGGETEKRRITLHFNDDDLLESVSGNVSPSDSPRVAKVHLDEKVSVPRYRDKPWSTRMKEKIPFVKESEHEVEASESETKDYVEKLTRIQEERRKAGSKIEAGIQPAPGKKPLKDDEYTPKKEKNETREEETT